MTDRRQNHIHVLHSPFKNIPSLEVTTTDGQLKKKSNVTRRTPGKKNPTKIGQDDDGRCSDNRLNLQKPHFSSHNCHPLLVIMIKAFIYGQRFTLNYRSFHSRSVYLAPHTSLYGQQLDYLHRLHTYIF